MNYTTEYQELTHRLTGERGIFAKLKNTEFGDINIIAGEDCQIAKRIIYLVSNGIAQYQSLEDGLAFDDDLFVKDFNNFTKIFEPGYEEYIYIHKNFQ